MRLVLSVNCSNRCYASARGSELDCCAARRPWRRMWLEPRPRADPEIEGRFAEVVHGLYWLTLNLAERGPFVAVIDDAHWADSSSLRFLGYLAGRLEGAGVLVVVAARGAEAPAAESLLERLVRERVTRVVRPRALSVAATAAVLALEYRVEVAPEFARACHEATRGNPFYVHELIHALQADGIDPSAAQVSRVAGQGPAGVARSVLTRIASLPPRQGTSRALWRSWEGRQDHVS